MSEIEVKVRHYVNGVAFETQEEADAYKTELEAKIAKDKELAETKEARTEELILMRANYHETFNQFVVDYGEESLPFPVWDV